MKYQIVRSNFIFLHMQCTKLLIKIFSIKIHYKTYIMIEELSDRLRQDDIIEDPRCGCRCRLASSLSWHPPLRSKICQMVIFEFSFDDEYVLVKESTTKSTVGADFSKSVIIWQFLEVGQCPNIYWSCVDSRRIVSFIWKSYTRLLYNQYRYTIVSLRCSKTFISLLH
jgi:hypothetical protein